LDEAAWTKVLDVAEIDEGVIDGKFVAADLFDKQNAEQAMVKADQKLRNGCLGTPEIYLGWFSQSNLRMDKVMLPSRNGLMRPDSVTMCRSKASI
jgi:hypothetical protein